MHATLLLLLTQAALVTVAPTASDACPSAARVQAALEKHAPRLLVARGDEDPAKHLVLTLSPSPSTRELNLSLLDGKGRVRLYRSLPSPAPDRPRDCAALADTVALIVDRYFDEVEIPSPPERKAASSPLPPLASAPASPLPTLPTGPSPGPPTATPPPAVPAPPTATPAPPPPAVPTPPPASPIPAPSATPPATPMPPPVSPAPPPSSQPAAPVNKTTTESATKTATKTATATATATSAEPPTETLAEALGRDVDSEPRSPFFTLSMLFGRRIPGAAQDLGGIEFKAALGLRLRAFGKEKWQLWAELSGGVVGWVNDEWDHSEVSPGAAGEATAIRSGVDLAPLLCRSFRRGRLYAGPIVSVEFVWLESTANDRLEHGIYPSVTAGLKLGGQYLLRQHIFLRADVNGSGAILRQRIVTQSKTDTPIFEAPPAYATFYVGLGMWF